jgi:hypothetical protein
VTGGSVFTQEELDYLHGGRRLARVATVGRDGTPHVVPSGFEHNRRSGPFGGEVHRGRSIVMPVQQRYTRAIRASAE